MAFNSKYSVFTLQPRDPEEKKLFWEFRVSTMWNPFLIYTILFTMMTLFTGIAGIFNPDLNALKWFLILLTFNVLHVSILLVSRKFKNVLAYALPINFLLNNLAMIWLRPDYA